MIRVRDVSLELGFHKVYAHRRMAYSGDVRVLPCAVLFACFTRFSVTNKYVNK